MAQTKKKRRRKHSGTQAGTVQRRSGAAAKPQSKEERREAARRARLERLDRPPTWRSSVTRAAIAAPLFAAVAILLLGYPVGQGIALGAVMLVLYIPFGYYMDFLIYRWRRRKKEREREERKSARQAK